MVGESIGDFFISSSGPFSSTLTGVGGSSLSFGATRFLRRRKKKVDAAMIATMPTARMAIPALKPAVSVVLVLLPAEADEFEAVGFEAVEFEAVEFEELSQFPNSG